MTVYLLWNAVGFVGAFIINGFIEWAVHRFIMHRSVPLIRYAYRTHALEHHVLFKADETYEAQNHEMRKDHGSFSWKEYTMLPLLCFLLYGAIDALTDKPILPGAMLAAVLGLLAYDFLHWSFHVPKDSWVHRTRLFRYLKEHHRLHHEDMSTNFNVHVLPYADFLLGTLSKRKVT